jgi:uncharacterized protein
MRFILCGGTGLVGDALVDRLLSDGHEVIVYSRSVRKSTRKGLTFLSWDPSQVSFQNPPKSDVLFNLAGATVGQRWSDEQKRLILDSRLQSTFLALTIAAQSAVDHVVQASAIGRYVGGEELMHEDSARDHGFLGDVVFQWEKEARIANLSDKSITFLRIGIVLAKDGGMLNKLLPLYKAGFGGPVSSKPQWLSWVHLEDVVEAFMFAGQHKLSGEFNLVAPNPVRYRIFSASLARRLKRPHFMPAPPLWLLRILLGGFADELTKSYNVSAQKLEDEGFIFRFGSIESALEDLAQR